MMEPKTSRPSDLAPSQATRPLALDPRWMALVAALLVLLIYLPAVRYQLLWDDTIFLRDTAVYRDPSLWPSALLRPFVLSPNYFRPLALLTFVVELALNGSDPTLFHLTNILLHAVNSALVTLLAIRLLRPTEPRAGRLRHAFTLFTLGLGLLYGLHPALIEGVAFISSRFDLLMTTLLLLALLADLSFRGRPARPVLVGLAFLLAALGKEMAVAFVLALPCWYLARLAVEKPRGSWWERIRGHAGVYAAVLLGGGIYLLVRRVLLGYLLVPGQRLSVPPGDALQHTLLFFKSMAGYVLLTLWPFGTLAPIHYSDLPIPLADYWAWLSLVLVGLLVAGLVWLLRRVPQAGWLALAGVLTLLPVANILPLELGGGAFIAERYLLFPMVFVVLAVGSLLRPLLVDRDVPVGGRTAWRRILPYLTTGLPLLWLVGSLTTIQLTLPHWRDDISLWTWAAGRAPLSATPLTNLSLQYANLGAYDQALQLADQAITLDPENSDAWDNAGLALFYMGQYAEAQAAFEQAVTLKPDSALYWNNLAGALREQDKLAEAAEILFEQALRLDPNLPPAYLNLGYLYLKADRPDLAQQYLQEALRLLPAEQAGDVQALLEQTHEPERWLRLGDVLLARGEYEPALRAFDQAGVLGAPVADVAAGVSAALIGLQDYQSAAQVLDQGLQVAPDDARLYNNAGVVAREQGDIELARQLFSRAIELAPEWELPQQNLEALPQE